MSNVIGITAKRSQKLIETGLELFSDGDVESAVDCFKKSIELNPNNSYAKEMVEKMSKSQ